jgi:hypothetical protein
VIREKLRGIAAGKGVGFLAGLMDGEIPVQFVGSCPHCHKACEIPENEEERLEELVAASVEQRLKANEQALKYGVGTQNEQLSEDEGRAYVAKTVGKLIDLLRADGRYTDQELHERYTQALEGG